jgi:hypothetical protein
MVITLTPGVIERNFFSFVTNTAGKQARVKFYVKHIQPSLMLVGEHRSLPYGEAPSGRQNMSLP